MKTCLTTLLLLIAATTVCQQVKNTSYTNQAGEKLLRLEFLLPLNIKSAWELFTKNEKLKTWIAPVVHIDLKTGGYMLTNYDTSKNLSDSTSIRLGIVNFLDQELITLKVKLNNFFPPAVRNSDGNLQELIQFRKTGENQTRIISTMVGFGTGKEWNDTYNFFVKGNIWTYEQLLKHYR
ncbi:hypothetical protein EXU57_06225 [Segetibacter sp. 3557_3]|uniref:hypothetical protein n=1 Tax=Segetibacter sp. 3557_3 TaxID=2547429 RepID=UPI0010587786|nr:hypothetical protein [Segetibacter sp. 3557_3]TDH28056.1 hypothetical protein EXU57_06225 [Segetibacter sp. 3557_3]